MYQGPNKQPIYDDDYKVLNYTKDNDHINDKYFRYNEPITYPLYNDDGGCKTSNPQNKLSKGFSQKVSNIYFLMILILIRIPYIMKLSCIMS